MIIFYEGLPRSGKSINALKEFVIPMLKKGRAVYAYIEGLNHEQIAKLASIDYDKCIELLIPLKREEVLDWFKIVPNDAFLVIDEIQNFYPDNRKQLDQTIIQAIAEHGHNGLDILIMGQVFSDVHKIWLGRCAQRVLFMKREAAGKPDEFTQIIYKPVVNGDKIKWQELRRIKGIPYDKAYFGSYKSHTDGTHNTDTLIDDRANVRNNPIIKKWLPIFGIVALISLFYIIYMFMGGGLEKSITANKNPTPINNYQQNINSQNFEDLKRQHQIKKDALQRHSLPQNIPTPSLPQPIKPDLTVIDDIESLNKQGRPRLSGFIKSRNKLIGFVEWRTDDFKILERLTFQQLKVYGYLVLLDADNSVAILTNGLNKFTVTAWPVNDPQGELTQHRIQLIASQPLAVDSSPKVW